MKIKLLAFVLIICGTAVFAQQSYLDNTEIVNGFAKKISGTDFSYHSSVPLVTDCMLIRATDGNSSMEWQTDAVPENIEKEFVTFIWLAGLGSSPGRARFDLEINGEQKFAIWADGLNEWNLKNEDGSTLAFQKDMIDQHGDRFGFMYLKIPAKNLKKGERLQLRITGGKFNSTSWYMTFKFQIKNKLNIKAFPAISENNGIQSQLGVAGILHFDKTTPAKIYIDNQLLKETVVNPGYNYIKIDLPKVEKSKRVNYKLELADRIEEGFVTLNPVKHWRINFVQHSHTDIGYTRSQTEILAEHLRYIDYALDYCDNTDNYPEDAKFRWTCEAMWPVDEYLKCRPAGQIERLKKRVAEGRIELAGMYFNFDELPDEQTLAASLQPIKNFRENGLEVKVAMQNDVNGIGWCLNDYYNDLGIKYLNMGTHGHRALIAFDKPTLFWWESPSGKRMLAYRAEHYMTGNTVFKIHAGDFNAFEDQLLSYLLNLEQKGYPYDIISIQHSGYLTDNSPPSTLASDMIREWNEKYTWPKLKTATATEFFEEMETKHGNEFQVIRGAWPDWWTDGFGASAREVAATRTAQGDITANATGLAMAVVQGSDLPVKINDRIENINNALLFYTEHTVGYHGSVREPFSKNTMEQRAIKESYAWEGSRKAKMLGEETMGLLQSFMPRDKEPSLLVFNTLNWERSGLFTVYIDHQLVPPHSKLSISDKNGNEAKAQPVEHFSDGTMWAVWVDNIPAFGFKKFGIKTSSTELPEKSIRNTKINELENQWYKISIDTKRGAISSITDKTLHAELVDPNSEWEMGEFIYETLDNRSQMEAYKLDNYTREPLDSVWFDGFEEGPVWNTVHFKGITQAAFPESAYAFEIRLFNTTKRIDFVYFIEKKLVTDPEGIYIAFPLQLEGGKLSFDVQGGEVGAGTDQIPGSSNDWNTVQNYARLSGSDAQIVLSSNEIPLMQFGGINTGRYKAGATPQSTHIFGWPMNNYWTTNFNAEQHGGITWTYSLTSSGQNSQTEATRFGWGKRVPFLTRILPGGGSGGGKSQGSFISGWPENMLLVSAFPGNRKNEIIFHVREVAGNHTGLKLKNEITGAPILLEQVNVLKEKMENGSAELNRFESKFFKTQF